MPICYQCYECGTTIYSEDNDSSSWTYTIAEDICDECKKKKIEEDDDYYDD